MATRKVIVGKVSDLKEGERVSVEIGGRDVVVFNIKGKFYALLNRCPHRGADLCTQGRLQPVLTAERPGEIVMHGDRRLLACPWHGWEFDVATGQSYFDPTGVRVRPFEVVVEKGGSLKVEVETGDASYTPQEYAKIVQASNAEGKLQPGPYKVETFDVTVEDDYVVVSSRPVRPPRSRRDADSDDAAKADANRKGAEL